MSLMHARLVLSCVILCDDDIVFQVPAALIGQIRQKHEDSSSANPVIMNNLEWLLA